MFIHLSNVSLTLVLRHFRLPEGASFAALYHATAAAFFHAGCAGTDFVLPGLGSACVMTVLKRGSQIPVTHMNMHMSMCTVQTYIFIAMHVYVCIDQRVQRDLLVAAVFVVINHCQDAHDKSKRARS